MTNKTCHQLRTGLLVLAAFCTYLALGLAWFLR